MRKGKIYFVGIKGVGMAGLAKIAQQQGFEVQGSDVAETFISDRMLKNNHIPVEIGFSRPIPPDTQLVVYTAAHQGSRNPQVRQAQKRGIPGLSYGQALAHFIQGKKVIAVSGTHGKTTTTALIAKILKDAGQDPGYLIGTGWVSDLGEPALWGKGKYFVVEADEYPADASDPHSLPKFLYLNPYALVILSTEYDHPDAFASPKTYWNCYKKLIKKTSSAGLAVVKDEGQDSQRVVKCGQSKTRVKLVNCRQPFPGLKLKILGEHNLCNATLAAHLTRGLGIDSRLIKKSLNSFQGLERRLELKYEGDYKIFDDYAHHPTEIKASLKALRQKYPKQKIICIFQAHTISRTQALLKDFGRSFGQADQVVVAPIFLSAREKAASFTGQGLASEIAKHHSQVRYLASFPQIVGWLKKERQPGDVIVVMGAGDIYKIISKLKCQIAK